MANIVVCIDPAYSNGINQGINPNYYEGTVMYDIALLLKEEIEKHKNFKAILSKCGEQNDPSIFDRVNNAVIMEANCFISLHSFNHYDYYMHKDTDYIKEDTISSIWKTKESSENLRILMYKALINSMKNTDLGQVGALDTEGDICIKNGVPFSYYTSIIELMSRLHEINMDSYIISFGYHTNYTFCEWALNKDNQQIFAKNLTDAIVSYYSEINE